MARTKLRLALEIAMLAIGSIACGNDGGAAGGDGEVRFDTAAGFRLGMLLPEARAAAEARGLALECEPAVTGPGSMPDSVYRHLREVDNCSASGGAQLQFFQGSLKAIFLSLGPDWDMIPVDTLVARLSETYGRKTNDEIYRYEDGRAERLVSWWRRGQPGTVAIRCPAETRAGQCEVELRIPVAASD